MFRSPSPGQGDKGGWTSVFQREGGQNAELFKKRKGIKGLSSPKSFEWVYSEEVIVAKFGENKSSSATEKKKGRGNDSASALNSATRRDRYPGRLKDITRLGTDYCVNYRPLRRSRQHTSSRVLLGWLKATGLRWKSCPDQKHHVVVFGVRG